MLQVVGLHLSVTESDLYDLFKKYGEVIWCEIRKDRATGFVSYNEPKEMSKAVEALDLQPYKGQKIHLAPYQSPFNHLLVIVEPDFNEDVDDVDENELQKYFQQFGPLAWTRLFEQKQHEFHFFVAFKNHQGAARAATALRQRRLPEGTIPHMYLYSTKVVDPEVPMDTSLNWGEPPADEQPFDGVNVRVNNLDLRVHTSYLKSLFSPYGTITSCKATRSSDYYVPGYGRVSFSNKEEAEKAIAAMNGKRILRFPIEVALEDEGKRGSEIPVEGLPHDGRDKKQKVDEA